MRHAFSTKRAMSGYSRAALESMREWARGQGMEVSERGRVPNGVVTAWESVHKGRGVA